MTDEAPLYLHQTLGQQRIVLMENGRAIIEYLAGMHMCHSGGVVQGGFVAGWIDAAMAHAVISATGGAVAPMSLEMKVSYFAPARPGIVVAEGWIEKPGKTNAFVEGVLRDSGGAILAKANSTLRLAPMSKVEAASKAALG